MVGEFPELQGLMGRYYATAQDEDPSVAAAIEEHYKPQGPNDRIPTAPVSIAVALADKLDTLVGFWAIDEKPTGSKDPYALRRAALGRHSDRAGERAATASLCPLSRAACDLGLQAFDMDFSRDAQARCSIGARSNNGFSAEPVAQDIREAFCNSDERAIVS